MTMDGFTATNATITGTITAETGKIGGFTISGNGLTHIVGQNDMYNHRYSDMGYIICRNDYYGRCAGIGANVLPASSGTSAVARFENEDTYGIWGAQFGRNISTNYAVIVSAKNSTTDNAAIAINGGHIQGLAIKTQIIGYDTFRQSTNPSSSDQTKTVSLARTVNAVIVSTQYYWIDTAHDNEKHTYTRDVNVNLPTMNHYDDGHMIWIKRGSNDDNTVKIIAGGSYHEEYNESTGNYVNKYYPTYLLTENPAEDEIFLDDIERTEYTGMDREGHSMCLIYIRDLMVTMNNTTYKGAWVEWKNPRYY